MSEDLHEMPVGEPGDSHDDPTVWPTAMVGAISAVLLILIVVGLEVLYYQTVVAESRRKFIEQEPQELRQVQAEQRQLLSGSRPSDAATDRLVLPIERAMELIVEETRRGRAERAEGR